MTRSYVSQSSWLPPQLGRCPARRVAGRAVDVGMRVVGADDLGSSFDGCPLPARPSDNRASGIGTQIAQLAGTTGGDESDDLHTGQRVLYTPR